MTLNSDDLNKIDEMIANRLEAEQIVSIFQSMDERQKEELAESISRFMWDRQQALRKPNTPYTVRWLWEGANIDEDLSGNGVGHSGPTLARIVEVHGGAAWLDGRSTGEHLHLRVGGGGADCMFDYLVSECWADEVAAGRGTEGQQFTSVSGCTFEIYSTWQGAVDDVAAIVGSDDKRVIFVCPGDYAEDVTFTMETSASPLPDIVGAGNERVFVRSLYVNQGGQANSGWDVWRDFSIKGNGTRIFKHDQTEAEKLKLINITFGATGGSGGEIYFDTPDQIKCESCEFLSAVTVNDSEGISFSHCHFSGANVSFLLSCENVIFDGCTLATSRLITAGGLSGRGWEDCAITGCYFTTTSSISSFIEFGSTGRSDIAKVSITGNTFDVPSGGISAAAILISSPATSGEVRQSLSITSNAFHGVGSATVEILANVSANPAYGVTFVSNTILANGSSQWAEDVAGASVNGAFERSIFALNTPPQKIRYNITGTTNQINSVEITDGAPSQSSNEGALAFDATNDTLYVNESSGYGSTWVVVGVSGGGAAAPSPHDFVGTHHDHDTDYTQTPNVDGIGVGGGDIDVYSDNGSTQTGEWDSTTGHLAIGGTIETNKSLTVKTAFTDPAAQRIGASIETTIVHTSASAVAHAGLSVAPNLSINAAATQSGSHHALQSGFALDDGGQGGTFSDVAAWAPTMTVVSGTVTAMRMVHVHDATVVGGSITTLYGIDIADLAAATTNVALRNAGLSRLVKGVTIGADAAVTSGLILDITGTVGHKAAGVYRFYDSDDSNYVGLKSPATAQSENWVYALPSTDPVAGYKLQVSTVSSPNATIEPVKDYVPIVFVIDGGGSAITTGVKGDIYLSENLTVESVTMLADQSGSIVVDIWQDTYANYPPTDADSITASAPPTITTATKSQDSTLTGWDTSLDGGSSLRYNVDSASTITRVTVTLTCYRR